MDIHFLFPVFVFLTTACLVVPLASRFKLGSILGYLLAGVLIGPFGFGLIGNAEQIMHFAEFGVVMMLFVIGLELEPTKLWSMRKSILGLGGLQVTVTSLLFAAIGISLDMDWQASLAIGMALSLSSTALVLQMLQEKNLLNTAVGENSFAVLLFQDIAVIPILVIMPLLALNGEAAALQADGRLVTLPGWAHALAVAGIIAMVVVIGRYFSHHLFRFVAQTNLREVFTATSLALVVGITLLMRAVGVSPALGAFLAGLVLANSRYKHTLETDIEPFKGLLLGLFFISVGMGMDFSLLTAEPLRMAALVIGLMILKGAILWMLGCLFSLSNAHALGLAMALAQGGEFAFVLFQYAQGMQVIQDGEADVLMLAVALSMAATPLVMGFYSYYIVPRFMSVLPPGQFDEVNEKNPVIIAGYGRVGQIVGRFLGAQGVPITVLEKDPDQIELLRKFGSRGYFGDASRLDLLQSAHAEKARLLVVTVDDADTCLKIVRMAKQEFPNLKIIARARNRRHAYELHKAGVDYFKRETFDSSLAMAEEAMKMLGYPEREIHRKAQVFRKHDEATLQQSFAFFEQEPELISFSRQARGELERILQSDVIEEVPSAAQS